MTHKVRDIDENTAEYSDGAIRYVSGNSLGRQPGSLVKLHPGMTPIANREHALALVEAKREKAILAATDGMQRAIEANTEYSPRTEFDAWGVVIEKQTELAIEPEMGHASTQAAKLVGHAAGMLASDRTTIQDQRKQTVVIVGGDQADAYLEGLGIGSLSAGESERVASEGPQPVSVDDEADAE